MGLCNSKVSETSQARTLLLGLDSVGKTTLLYRMRLGELVQTTPTVGFNVESVSPEKGLTFTVWDVGGQSRLRPLWMHYFEGTEGLLFVVDSADRERMSEARKELFSILENDAMKSVPVCIIANTQDMPNALTPAEVTEQLDLNKLTGRNWYVQAACATTGDGIYDGMHQLAVMVKEYKRNGKKKIMI